jgi:hypothetical protein
MEIREVVPEGRRFGLTVTEQELAMIQRALRLDNTNDDENLGLFDAISKYMVENAVELR